MKTRVLHTRFWSDGVVTRLSPDATYLFVYLLTNDRINMCGMYELPVSRMAFDLKKSVLEVQSALDELVKSGRVRYVRDWVAIPNVGKYNSFFGPKNEIALKKELAQIPDFIMHTSMDTSMDTSTIPTSNKKSVISNQKELGESEREEEMMAFWKQHRGSTIRKDIPGNIKAYKYLRKEFGDELEGILLVSRMIQDDTYQKRTLQAKMTNFIGIMENIEQVEAYKISVTDQSTVGKIKDRITMTEEDKQFFNLG